MKIKNLKDKIIRISLVFILIGTLISIAGFGAAGFQYDRLKEGTGDDIWYQTIHTDSDNFWYGIDLGNGINLFAIGDSD